MKKRAEFEPGTLVVLRDTIEPARLLGEYFDPDDLLGKYIPKGSHHDRPRSHKGELVMIIEMKQSHTTYSVVLLTTSGRLSLVHVWDLDFFTPITPRV